MRLLLLLFRAPSNLGVPSASPYEIAQLGPRRDPRPWISTGLFAVSVVVLIRVLIEMATNR